MNKMLTQKQTTTFEEPKEFTVQNVQYWCRHTKELKHSQVSKAVKFLEHNCIHYIGNNRFVCLPLNRQTEWKVEEWTLFKIPYEHDYNSSEYIIERKGNIWSCNCQGYCQKEKKGEIINDGICCSHTLALIYFFKLKGKK